MIMDTSYLEDNEHKQNARKLSAYLSYRGTSTFMQTINEWLQE